MAISLLTVKNTKQAKHTYLNSQKSVGMDKVAAIILGGGQGSRLAPLTLSRCKPAVSFGGKYHLIDIPMSHAINAGCSKIFVLTQFLSASLHKHILNTYRMSSFSNNSIELLSAEQKPTDQSWFQGPADAVRKNLEYLVQTPTDYFLILSGDQLYNFDFQKMLAFAQETDADLTIASLPVNEYDAKRMGILKFNEDRFVTEFQEKPQSKELLDRLKLPEFILEQLGETGNDKNRRQYLGSMGIYLFKREALFNLLNEDTRDDFGKHIIPTKVLKGSVAAYIYDDYWEDIGTIEAFFNANIALTSSNPPFNCYDDKNPIYAQQHNLPAPKIIGTHVEDSIICEGSIIHADLIKNCIFGPRSVVKQGTIIRNSYVLGNDYYNPPVKASHLPNEVFIGENCLMDHCIIDKNVRIGNGVQLINKNKLKHHSHEHIYIRDGIIVVASGANIPDGYIL